MKTVNNVPSLWDRAQDALQAAKDLPVGAERAEALRKAGQMRFDADKQRQSMDNGSQMPKTTGKT